jgi:hypothetical protein
MTIRDTLVPRASEPRPSTFTPKDVHYAEKLVAHLSNEASWVPSMMDFVRDFNASPCYDGIVYCKTKLDFYHTDAEKAFREYMKSEKGITFEGTCEHGKVTYYMWKVTS